jgi:signal transduction histidine kinase
MAMRADRVVAAAAVVGPPMADVLFLRRLHHATDVDAVARVLAQEHWIRFRQACVVMLRDVMAWRVAAVGGAGQQAWQVPTDGDVEDWLATVTLYRHWKREDVYDGRRWVARVYAGTVERPSAQAHAPSRSLCLLAAPFFGEGPRARNGGELVQQMAQFVHDLKQPLATMAMSLAMMQPSAEQRQYAERCRRSIDRQREMLEDLPHLIGARRATHESVRLDKLLAAVVEDVRTHGEARAVTVQLELRVGANIVGSYTGLRRAIGNVVLNAVQMTPPNSTVTLLLERRRVGVAIEVRDQGPGVPLPLREQLFQPFVSKRPGGCGLGLAVARSVAREHGGTVRFVDGAGGRVRFELPRAQVHPH